MIGNGIVHAQYKVCMLKIEMAHKDDTAFDCSVITYEINFSGTERLVMVSGVISVTYMVHRRLT